MSLADLGRLQASVAAAAHKRDHLRRLVVNLREELADKEFELQVAEEQHRQLSARADEASAPRLLEDLT
jgi:hypothetical protein